MKIRLVLITLLCPFFLNAQQIIIDTIGVIPSECRLFGYQNPSGIVFVSASGGIPPFDYLWTNMQTGATSQNSTWGGLTPGSYKIKVTDNNNDSVVTFVMVDSITPISNFGVSGSGLSEISAGYIGFAPVSANFHNLSQYTATLDPMSGGIYAWQFVSGGSLDITQDSLYSPSYYYSSGGTYSATLTVQNQHGCSDTKTKQIGLFDLTDTDELSNGFFSLEASQENIIIIEKNNHFDPIIFKLFDLNGKLVLEKKVSSSVESIQHFQNNGIYLYQMIDTRNSNSLSGKIYLK